MLWTKAVALEVLTKTGAGILDVPIGMDEDLEHPAMFLEKRIEPFVKATTEKNDLVLDVLQEVGPLALWLWI